MAAAARPRAAYQLLYTRFTNCFTNSFSRKFITSVVNTPATGAAGGNRPWRSAPARPGTAAVTVSFPGATGGLPPISAVQSFLRGSGEIAPPRLQTLRDRPNDPRNTAPGGNAWNPPCLFCHLNSSSQPILLQNTDGAPGNPCGPGRRATGCYASRFIRHGSGDTPLAFASTTVEPWLDVAIPIQSAGERRRRQENWSPQPAIAAAGRSA